MKGDVIKSAMSKHGGTAARVQMVTVINRKGPDP